MAQDLLRLAKEVTMKESTEEAINVVLKDYLDRRMAECEKEMRRYEKKHGMSFEEFERRISDREFNEKLQKKYGVIQVENDYFDWSGAVTDFYYFKERAEKLRK